MTDPTLVTTLRLLFDGKEYKELAQALNEALGEKYFIVSRDMQEQKHVYSMYWVSPDEFEDRLVEHHGEVFIGPSSELELAAYACVANAPDSIYETVGYHLDNIIEEFRKNGWTKKA